MNRLFYSCLILRFYTATLCKKLRRSFQTGKQGNTFSVRDVLSIMKACETMAKTLEERFYPERIAFTGSEAKRFSLYQRVAKKLCAGRKVWTEPSSLTVWVELQDEWC